MCSAPPYWPSPNDHPRVGRLQFDLFELRLAHAPSPRLVLHTPAGPADQAVLRQLARDEPARLQR
jgi:hypothetical protein